MWVFCCFGASVRLEPFVTALAASIHVKAMRMIAAHVGEHFEVFNEAPSVLKREKVISQAVAGRMDDQITTFYEPSSGNSRT